MTVLALLLLCACSQGGDANLKTYENPACGYKFNIERDWEYTDLLQGASYGDNGAYIAYQSPADNNGVSAAAVTVETVKGDVAEDALKSLDQAAEELKITGKAILDYEYHEDNRYLIIRAEPCDPNILGVISDFAMETAEVDVCMAYYESANEIKFSVRSCVKEVHADELAAFLADGIGGGGGHLYKAGGTIRPELIEGSTAGILEQRMAEYYKKYETLYAKDTLLDTSDMKFYTKLSQRLGTVHLTDIFPAGSQVEIRTLEGDVNVSITDDTYLMIGIEGEVYPISGAKLANSYDFTGFVFSKTFEYEPSVKNISTGEVKPVMPYAKTVISPPGNARIYAKPLDHAIKLFTAWDDEKYYSGNIGDYIAVREDDPHDIYIIKGRLFDQLYKEI